MTTIDDASNDPSVEKKGDRILLTLAESARNISSETFTLTLMQEIATQSAAYEPTLMRHGDGWLSGPADIHVTDITRATDGSSVDVRLSLRFQIQSVPGCGTDAQSKDHHLPAHLQIQLPSGISTLAIGFD